MREEFHQLSNAMLHWKQQGPWHLKLGSNFESCSLQLPHPFGPMGYGGVLHGSDALKVTPLPLVNLLGRAGGNKPLLWKQGEACRLSDPSVAMIEIQSKTSELITT